MNAAWKARIETVLWSAGVGALLAIADTLGPDGHFDWKHTASVALTGAVLGAAAVLRQLPREPWTDEQRGAAAAATATATAKKTE